MDKELTEKFNQIESNFEKLATMVADGFANITDYVNGRFNEVDKRFDLLESEIRELRNETRAIRAELERMPDNIDATYAPSMNDLLDRIMVIEKKLGIS